MKSLTKKRGSEIDPSTGRNEEYAGTIAHSLGCLPLKNNGCMVKDQYVGYTLVTLRAGAHLDLFSSLDSGHGIEGKA